MLSDCVHRVRNSLVHGFNPPPIGDAPPHLGKRGSRTGTPVTSPLDAIWSLNDARYATKRFDA